MLYCTECRRVINSYDIWFLYNNREFDHRKLYIGRCPKCHKDVVSLVEYRKSDGKIFIDRHSGNTSSEILDKCVTQLWYRQKDLIMPKGKPYGFVFGENRERKKNIVVYACDWFGNKELIDLKKA